MKDERIGVEVVLTNRYSIWDGVAVAITDPVNTGETTFRFYNGIGAVGVVKGLLIEGLEVAKVGLITYRYSTMADFLRMKEGLARLAPGIKVELVADHLDPFKDIEIPPNH